MGIFECEYLVSPFFPFFSSSILSDVDGTGVIFLRYDKNMQRVIDKILKSNFKNSICYNKRTKSRIGAPKKRKSKKERSP